MKDFIIGLVERHWFIGIGLRELGLVPLSSYRSFAESLSFLIYKIS